MATETLESYAKRKTAIRALEPSAILSKALRFKHSIKDVLKGGYIRLYDDTYKVVGISTYKETDDTFKKPTGSEWNELTLFSLKTGELAFLEWEEDDVITMSFTTASLSFRELKDDEGGAVDDEDLDEMADKGWSLFNRGTEYKYDDDYAAKYDRGSAPGRRSERETEVYFYDFSNGSKTITVEEWRDEVGKYDYEVFLSQTVTGGDFEIISLGPNQ